MLVTMTGERKWHCLGDRWGGSHVLSLVSPTPLSLSVVFACSIGMINPHGGMIPELCADLWQIPTYQFGFCSFKLTSHQNVIHTIPISEMQACAEGCVGVLEHLPLFPLMPKVPKAIFYFIYVIKRPFVKAYPI